MGVFCVKFNGTTIIAEIFLNIFSGNLLKSRLFLDADGFSEEYRRTPSSPVAVAVQRPKEKLVLIEYGRLLERSGYAGVSKEGDSQCAICLNRIELGNQVRELGNCWHAFHKQCIDLWMDQRKLTCPLCRSKLLPDLIENSSSSVEEIHGRQENDLLLS